MEREKREKKPTTICMLLIDYLTREPRGSHRNDQGRRYH